MSYVAVWYPTQRDTNSNSHLPSPNPNPSLMFTHHPFDHLCSPFPLPPTPAHFPLLFILRSPSQPSPPGYISLRHPPLSQFFFPPLHCHCPPPPPPVPSATHSSSLSSSDVLSLFVLFHPSCPDSLFRWGFIFHPYHLLFPLLFSVRAKLRGLRNAVSLSPSTSSTRYLFLRWEWGATSPVFTPLPLTIAAFTPWVRYH